MNDRFFLQLVAMFSFALAAVVVGVALKETFQKIKIEPSNEHKRLCMEYALKDHRWEIGQKRFEWLSKAGDPNDVEFFYESCLGQVTGEPATKEYMK